MLNYTDLTTKTYEQGYNEGAASALQHCTSTETILLIASLSLVVLFVTRTVIHYRSLLRMEQDKMELKRFIHREWLLFSMDATMYILIIIIGFGAL